MARLAGLPPAQTYDVAVERDLRIPMPDGVVLLADRYFPRRGDNAPIVLMRSPYGRRTLFGVLARIFAERGYQAVVQSVRGTFGSGGVFDAMRHEAADGRATLDWLAAQQWFAGSVAMTGPSYLGFVQWAVAAGAPDYLKALAPQITAAQFRTLTYPGESFALKTAMSWMYVLHYQERSFWRLLWASARQQLALAPAFSQVPLSKADQIVAGAPVAFYQDWLAHAQPGDPFWEAIDYSHRLDAVTAPVNLVAGWYDIFLPAQLADYAALKQAGRQPHLTIGPWIHVSPAVMGAMLKESLAWFDTYLRGDASRLRQSPVRIFVMGAKRWLDLPDWPPAAVTTRWHLRPGGALGPEPPSDSQPDTYRYDPASPTPSVGGTVLTADAGPKDNRKLESRPDVLTYTSAPLDGDLEVVGPVAAELYVRSSLEYTDFFARLCDVEPTGRSINVCDGLVRLWPGRFPQADDGSVCARIDLWPTAYRFRQGHRVRLQVSSGAHPRYARNLGGGEPLGVATTFNIADQTVFHDAAHPSAVLLPVHAAADS
ncbi:MAG TPA: CocE/NonD family hydrolase [Ktedonobacterales bacterium]